ncbi:alpha/beta hydrolase [Streptomyces sp. Ru73]|nr:alpha/beta hydrolase [Streptomyces sp. Ru73]
MDAERVDVERADVQRAEAEEAALLACAPVAPDDSVTYGSHPDQVVDLYRPPGGAPVPPAGHGPAPLVVLLHGGFWRVAYDRTHLSPLAAALARSGLQVALAEYRRAGGGGGLPESFNDVTDAVRIAAAEAAPGTPVIVAGHSAGGHLALWTAARPGPAAAAVAIAPVADLARAHALRLSNGAVEEFLTGGTAAPGTPAALTDRIAAVDPVRLPPRVPVTILHGTADPDVPVELSRRYAEQHGGARSDAGEYGLARGGADRGAHERGVPQAAEPGVPHQPPVVLRELPGMGHYAAATPGTPAYEALREALLAAAARTAPDGGKSGGTGP